jgi:hypothetical protein
MSHYSIVAKMLGGMLLSFGAAMTLFGAGAAPAQADSSFGPWTCCPGQNEGHPQGPRSGMPLFGCGGELGQECLPHVVERLLRARKRRAHYLGWT